MNSKHNNRSVQRTKRLLKESLIELLQTAPITKISVTKLTELATINRGTFYLHYKDIYELLDELENDIINDINSILDRHPAEYLKSNLLPILCDFFEYINQNANLVRTMLQIENYNSFLQKIKLSLEGKCFSYWEILFTNKKKTYYDSYYSFIISGCIGLMEYWIEQGMKETPEEIAMIAESIIMHGIEALQ